VRSIIATMLIHKENKIMKNKWIKMVALEGTMNECIGNHYTEEDDSYTELFLDSKFLLIN
jgi:hypothetical protein